MDLRGPTRSNIYFNMEYFLIENFPEINKALNEKYDGFNRSRIYEVVSKKLRDWMRREVRKKIKAAVEDIDGNPVDILAITGLIKSNLFRKDNKRDSGGKAAIEKAERILTFWSRAMVMMCEWLD